MRVTLVSLPVEASAESVPLGAACVAAAIGRDLRGRARAVLLEFSPSDSATDMVSRIASTSPDWVGFSFYSWNRLALVNAARACKSAFPSAVLFAGGPEASAAPRSLLDEAPFDFVVVGEGEAATVRALGARLEFSAPAGRDEAGAKGFDIRLALAGMRGIVLRGDEGLVRRSPPEDPARLPSPWLEGTLDSSTLEGALWELARGCPYRCAYCYESKGESRIRYLPMERIRAELELFVRKGMRQVFVLDPTFNADRARARELLILFREKAPGIHWKFEVRAELLDREQVRLFASLDCSLQIGLQSVDRDALALVNRDLDRKDFARKIGLLNAEGVAFGLDLIYALPGDSLSGLRESLDFALSLQPDQLDIFPLSILPGTELAGRVGELGIVADSLPPYLVRSSHRLPAADFALAAALARSCDLFYSKGRAVAWFLSALKPLRLKSSAFLERFAARAEEMERRGAPSSLDIELAQLSFLEEFYRERKLEPLLPALRDIVRCHGAWGRAAAEGESATLELAYDPDELMGPVALDLAGFVRSARPRPCRLKIGPGKSGVPRMERARGSTGSRGSGGASTGRRS